MHVATVQYEPSIFQETGFQDTYEAYLDGLLRPGFPRCSWTMQMQPECIGSRSKPQQVDKQK